MQVKTRRNEAEAARGVGGAPASPVASSHARWRVVPEASTEIVGERASSTGVLLFSAVVFLLTFGLVLGVWQALAGVGVAAIAVALVCALLATAAVHIAQQWEKVVVLRFGTFNRVSGPGLFWTFPVIEQNTMRVDTRVRATTFGAEETLTADLVPVTVDAVLFWVVWDAEKACTEVEDYYAAVSFLAQTAMREAVGRSTVAEVALRRDQLDAEIKDDIEKEAAGWGVDIISVKVRDIVIPDELQEAMSLEAQAEQRKKARIILMEAEQDICEMMDDMGDTYAKNDAALRLRAMHLLYESVRETGGTVVVPSSFSEGFGDVLGDAAKDALGGKTGSGKA